MIDGSGGAFASSRKRCWRHRRLGESGSGTGIFGYSSVGTGIFGHSSVGTGIFGHSSVGTGIFGHSSVGTGIYAETRSTTKPATLGLAYGDNTGVYGFSGFSYDSSAATPAKTGVYGYAEQDAAAVGVKGESPAGTGVLATSSTGTALQVAGKAKLSRSGRASVLANKTYVDVTPSGGLASNSVVHATLQTYRAGVSIAAVRLNYPTAGKARIYLTKIASTTSSTYIGWFVAEY